MLGTNSGADFLHHGDENGTGIHIRCRFTHLIAASFSPSHSNGLGATKCATLCPICRSNPKISARALHGRGCLLQHRSAECGAASRSLALGGFLESGAFRWQGENGGQRRRIISAESSCPGKPLSAWKRAWTKAKRQASVECRIHDLRRHFISALAHTQTPDATVQAISGHLSRKMLEREWSLLSRIRIIVE
jgi:hypothetical protein